MSREEFVNSIIGLTLFHRNDLTEKPISKKKANDIADVFEYSGFSLDEIYERMIKIREEYNGWKK